MTFQRPESVSTFRHGLGNLLRAFRAGRVAPVIFGHKNRAEFVLLPFDSYGLLLEKALRAYDAAAIPTLLDRLTHPRGAENASPAVLATWIGAADSSASLEDGPLGFWPSAYDDARELARTLNAEEKDFFLSALFGETHGRMKVDDERLGTHDLVRFTVPPLRAGSTAVLVYAEFVDEDVYIVAMVIPDPSFSAMLASEPMEATGNDETDEDG